MVAKIHFTVLIFIYLGWTIQAQVLPDQSEVTAYREAESAMVLLENEGELIPLRQLDTLRVAYFSNNMEATSELLRHLRKYTKVVEWYPVAGAEHLHSPEADLLIVGVDPDVESAGNWAVMQEDSLLQSIRKIAVWLGTPAQLADAGKWPSMDGMLVSPGPEPFASSLAAQALFGAVGVSGKLSANINEKYRSGSGLETEAIQRLGYAPPGVVGMDAQYLEDSIRAIVEEGLRAEAYPGAQVLVAKDGKIIYHRTFGTWTYDRERPVKETDLYDFASVTKVTGPLPAVMKLYGEGKFDLDAPLEKYVPEMAGSNKADATYRSILAHNARFLPYINYWQATLRGNSKYPWQKRWDSSRINDYRFRARTFKRDSSARFPTKVADDLWLHRDFKKKIYKSIRKSPLNEEPGYKYSGLLFLMLPDIISDLTGADYETYLKQNFYRRLGAYTMTYNPLWYFPKSRIVPTENDTFFSMMQIHGRVHDEAAAVLGGVSGNAGLFASANDLAKLFQMYMNKGTYGGERYIAEKAIEEFIRCQYCEEGNRRGLGFDKPLIEYNENASSVAKDASPTSFGHSGYTGTFVWADPDNNLLYIFFSNRVFPTRNNAKIYQLGIRPRIHQVLYDAMYNRL